MTSKKIKFQEEPKMKNTMKEISIDNGNTFVSPAEALEVITLDTMAMYMDDEIREMVNAELAPCTEIEFLAYYLEFAVENLIIG